MRTVTWSIAGTVSTTVSACSVSTVPARDAISPVPTYKTDETDEFSAGMNVRIHSAESSVRNVPSIEYLTYVAPFSSLNETPSSTSASSTGVAPSRAYSVFVPPATSAPRPK